MESASDKELDQLLNEHFAGRVVRKDLTKLIKEGANVPVYVLEYLLGMYCASDDPEVIEQGLNNVKTVLAENYVRPDEAEKVKSLVKERGTYKVIDRVTVKLNEKKDKYEASFSNLGIKDAEISSGIVKEYEKLLAADYNLMPDNLTWESTPPVVPDKDGNYALPMPATYKLAKKMTS